MGHQTGHTQLAILVESPPEHFLLYQTTMLVFGYLKFELVKLRQLFNSKVIDPEIFIELLDFFTYHFLIFSHLRIVFKTNLIEKFNHFFSSPLSNRWSFNFLKCQKVPICRQHLNIIKFINISTFQRTFGLGLAYNHNLIRLSQKSNLMTCSLYIFKRCIMCLCLIVIFHIYNINYFFNLANQLIFSRYCLN